MQALIDNNTPIHVTDNSPNLEPRYRARFYFDPSSITMVSGNAHYIFYGYSPTPAVILRVELRFSNGNYQIRASLVNDATTWRSSSWFTISVSDNLHYIEIDWRASTAPSANNGGLTLWIDGVQKANMTGVDNDTRRMDMVRLGAVFGVDTGTRGTYCFDAFESRRTTYIGLEGVQADFTATPLTGGAPLTVSFSDASQSSAPITSYNWDFGDGSTSTEANPVHTYTAEGLYSVSLTVDTGSQSDTAVKADYINVTNTIFADGFESGNFSAWSANKPDAGDLSVTSAAAMVGSYGMQAVIDDTVLIYVTDDNPNQETHYWTRFLFDPNSISMVSGNAHFILYGYQGTTVVLRLEFRRSSGLYQLRASLLKDGTGWVFSPYITIGDAPHEIVLDWQAASAVGANDGSLSMLVDGTQQVNLTGIDNDTRRIGQLRLGPVSGLDSGTTGTYYFDDFESKR
jgi:PKD repeat protein